MAGPKNSPDGEGYFGVRSYCCISSLGRSRGPAAL
jgi:hypothetical protein